MYKNATWFFSITTFIVILISYASPIYADEEISAYVIQIIPIDELEKHEFVNQKSENNKHVKSIECIKERNTLAEIYATKTGNTDLWCVSIEQNTIRQFYPIESVRDFNLKDIILRPYPIPTPITPVDGTIQEYFMKVILNGIFDLFISYIGISSAEANELIERKEFEYYYEIDKLVEKTAPKQILENCTWKNDEKLDYQCIQNGIEKILDEKSKTGFQKCLNKSMHHKVVGILDSIVAEKSAILCLDTKTHTIATYYFSGIGYVGLSEVLNYVYPPKGTFEKIIDIFKNLQDSFS